MEKLTREYDIRICIHNHGPEEKLWPSSLNVLKDIRNLDPRIGCCIDVGHQRIATNGDVRLSPTPAHWDPIPTFERRKHGAAPNELTASCTYPDHDLSYRVDVRPEAGGFRVAVQLDKPIPAALVGKAGFNLEFLPHCTSANRSSPMSPREFSRGTTPDQWNELGESTAEPLPLATGENIVLSPEDPLTRVAIHSEKGPLALFDGRNQAQNGWYVVRTLIPAGKTGDVVVWRIHPNVIAGWIRPPVISYNQMGYTPKREKIAVIELDPAFAAPRPLACCASPPMANLLWP